MADPEELLNNLTLLTASQQLRAGTTTSEGLVRASLARISQLESTLHAFIQLMPEAALEQALQADREIQAGKWRGPLHGIPLAIKDLLDVEGVPTTAGMTIFSESIATSDATVVRRLRKAGAVIVGKTHMTEGATLSHHARLPRPQNPWKPGFWPGVSSSGSGIAVAARFCLGAIGTDTGGSIRMPATACGLTGLKPTWGRVSRSGLFPMAESFDHIGPMAGNAADAAALLQVIAGWDATDITSLPNGVPDYLQDLEGDLRGLRLGIDLSACDVGVTPEIAANVQTVVEVLAHLGMQVKPISLPAFESVNQSVMPLVLAEMAVAHDATYPAQSAHYGHELRHMLDTGLSLPSTVLARCQHARNRLSGALRRIFEEVDIFITPAAPAQTPRWVEVDALKDDLGAFIDRVARFTLAFDASGSPALSMPSGFSASGLPLGVQLVGPHLGEPVLLRCAHRFQQLTTYHDRRSDMTWMSPAAPGLDEVYSKS